MSDSDKPSRRWNFGWRSVVVFVGLIGAGYYLWARVDPRNAAASPGHAANTGGATIPVVAAHARRGDIGVYITALGSVTPIYTVTVKTRVDGQLMAVNYKEGETVQQGAPLVEIDPRPYQALLEQYEGQLKRDQALLANAKVDLAR